ncbi:MAG: hypothetical protein HFI04_04630 [Lachnospiraceae bacterium]|nr:hypothetical protein [Lachnospiraceae bacterium]
MGMWTDIGKKMGKKWDKWELGLLAVSLGFYLFFAFYDGPVWCKDSLSYATMDLTREPLYPTFLWIFRRMFGEESYLVPVVFVQSLLAAYATWKLAVTVKRDKGNSNILALLSVLFQFGVTILCRFVAARRSSYICSIMTEGLGLSLYVLFIVQLYRYMMEEKKRNLAGTVFFALLLVNLRKQMLITICLMAAVFVLYYLIKERRVKKLLFLLVLTAGIFFACKFTDRLYNYCVRGAWIEHSGNSMGMLCTLVYTAEAEDSGLFEDETLRGLYEEISAEADRQGLKIAYAPEGWVDLSSHYADSYDAIGYGIINPVVQGYVREHDGYTGIDAVLKYDEYCNAMVKTLFGQKKGNLIRVYVSNTWKGFINSIARVNRYLNLCAAAAYILYLLLYARRIWRNKGWAKRDESGTMAEIVFGSVAVNCFVVGAMIFCQPRYMIYSMGLFYTALSMMIYDEIKGRALWRNGNKGKWLGNEEKNHR